MRSRRATATWIRGRVGWGACGCALACAAVYACSSYGDEEAARQTPSTDAAPEAEPDASDGGVANGDGSAAAPDAAADGMCALPFAIVDATVGPPWRQDNYCGSEAPTISPQGCLLLGCPASAAYESYNVISTPIAPSDPGVIAVAFDVRLASPSTAHTFAQLVGILAKDANNSSVGNLAFEQNADRVRLYDQRAPGVLVFADFPIRNPAANHHVEILIRRGVEVKSATFQVAIDETTQAFIGAMSDQPPVLQLGSFLNLGPPTSAVTSCFSLARRSCP